MAGGSERKEENGLDRFFTRSFLNHLDQSIRRKIVLKKELNDLSLCDSNAMILY